MKASDGDHRRLRGDPAFAVVLTVRADTQDEAMSSLDFLEPGWGVAAVSAGLASGSQQLLVQVDDEPALRRLRQAASRHRRIVSCVDRLWAMSAGGPVRVQPRDPARPAEDLAFLYTRGAGRLAAAIAAHPDTAAEVTGRPNRVAVISDGSAVLGMGNVGPAAVLPLLEAKAALYAQIADIDAMPLCVNTGHVHGTDSLVATIRAVAPTFGAVNLTGFASPACRDLERRLRIALDVPVFHDEQHAIPVVVLAALRNALRVAGKDLHTARIVVLGAGVTGSAVTRLLLHAGARDVTVCTGQTIVGPDLDRLPEHTAWLAGLTNPRRLHGGPEQAIAGADAVVGLNTAVRLDQRVVGTMKSPPVVFALAGPPPAVGPTAVTATCHPDHPNHLTGLLAFPGIVRGLLNARAPRITTTMLLAAADVLAGWVGEDALGPHRLLPDVLDPRLVSTVAAAVAAVEASRRRAQPAEPIGEPETVPESNARTAD
ncbi:NAD(P)-dependent malic enzyme [Dactylosporangium salmoneum]|uniref:NAD-dependent malic enzyme n=1 Tax=Dactylosporangium salmoneum TaxID=53361 RepID=A0ABN3GRT2_9ACTN